jgi:outer membrane protein assembly factor BamB
VGHGGVADSMLVFGGHTGTATNDLWELDVATGKWELKVSHLSLCLGHTLLAPNSRRLHFGDAAHLWSRRPGLRGTMGSDLTGAPGGGA